MVNLLRQALGRVRRLEFADGGGDVRHIGPQLSDLLSAHVDRGGYSSRLRFSVVTVRISGVKLMNHSRSSQAT